MAESQKPRDQGKAEARQFSIGRLKRRVGGFMVAFEEQKDKRSYERGLHHCNMCLESRTIDQPVIVMCSSTSRKRSTKAVELMPGYRCRSTEQFMNGDDVLKWRINSRVLDVTWWLSKVLG